MTTQEKINLIPQVIPHNKLYVLERLTAVFDTPEQFFENFDFEGCEISNNPEHWDESDWQLIGDVADDMLVGKQADLALT